MEKMTRREFLTAVSEAEGLDIKLKEFAAEEIVKMDKALAKRKSKQSAKALENAPLIKKIKLELLGEEPLLASAAADFLEVSVQKASALLRGMVADGIADVKDIRVKGKGVQKGYTARESTV